jgi:hypothetical protein
MSPHELITEGIRAVGAGKDLEDVRAVARVMPSSTPPRGWQMT